MTDEEQAELFKQYLWETSRRLFDHCGGDLSCLTEAEQETVLLWRVEADIYNGGILQWLCNWGYENFSRTVAVMEKIGARQTVALLRHVECALA